MKSKLVNQSSRMQCAMSTFTFEPNEGAWIVKRPYSEVWILGVHDLHCSNITFTNVCAKWLLSDNMMIVYIIFYFLFCRQEALTAAIGEKDAHIALLELNRKSPKTSEDLKLLKKEKDALVQQLKDEVGVIT